MTRKSTQVVAALLGLAIASAVPAIADAAAPQASTASVTYSARSVATGGDLTATGRVEPAGVRTVTLQRLMGEAWVSFRSVTTDDRGRYDVDIPTTTFVGAASYRAVAEATDDQLEAVSTSTTITIRTGGRDTAHTYLLGTYERQPYRWDPCTPINVKVNPRGAPDGYLADVSGALRRIDEQSGLRLRYAGRTGILPRTAIHSYPDGTDLVIAFVRPGQTDYFPVGSGAAAYGGAWGGYYVGDGGKLVPTLHTGFVVAKRSLYQELDPGFTAGKPQGWSGTRGQLLMHELGHAVGMGHADHDRAEIMYPQMQDHAAIWGAGDGVNLARLGRASGCIEPTTAARTAAGVASRRTDAVLGILD